MEMEAFAEGIEVETTPDNPNKTQLEQPEEVVIILPDESCFEYEGVKKMRSESGNKVSWTKAQTYALVQEYKNNREELENPASTKSVIWDKVAVKFNQKWNTNFNGEICSNKWRSLKNTYKKVRFSQRSESSKRKWEYYEVLNEVYKNMKLVKPNAAKVLGSMTIPVSAAAGLHQPDQPVHIVQFAPRGSTSSYGGMRASSPDPTGEDDFDSEPPSWFKEFIREYRSSEETKLRLLQHISKEVTRIGEKQTSTLEKMLVLLKKN